MSRDNSYIMLVNKTDDSIVSDHDESGLALKPTSGLGSPVKTDDYSQNRMGLIIKQALTTGSQSEDNLIEMLHDENGKLKDRA
jgi:hypothetical protein